MARGKKMDDRSKDMEDDLLPKKPKRTIKPMTEREYELNRHWYESDEAKAAALKYYSDGNGNLINNPFKLK